MIAAYGVAVVIVKRGRIVNVGIEIVRPDLHVAFVVVYNVVDVGSERAVVYYTVVDLTSDGASVLVVSEKNVDDDHYQSAADCTDAADDDHLTNFDAVFAVVVYDSY